MSSPPQPPPSYTTIKQVDFAWLLDHLIGFSVHVCEMCIFKGENSSCAVYYTNHSGKLQMLVAKNPRTVLLLLLLFE